MSPQTAQRPVTQIPLERRPESPIPTSGTSKPDPMPFRFTDWAAI
jgi:hypothetical protein